MLLMPGWTLFEQLALEESLMRSSQEMWCARGCESQLATGAL